MHGVRDDTSSIIKYGNTTEAEDMKAHLKPKFSEKAVSGTS